MTIQKARSKALLPRYVLLEVASATWESVAAPDHRLVRPPGLEQREAELQQVRDSPRRAQEDLAQGPRWHCRIIHFRSSLCDSNFDVSSKGNRDSSQVQQHHARYVPVDFRRYHSGASRPHAAVHEFATHTAHDP